MKSVNQAILGTALVFFAALACAAVAPADMVGINGKIYTLNSKQPWAEAIAVRGDIIVYVGDNEGAKAFIGKDTEVGNLNGRFVMPGLISGHEHPLITAGFAAAIQLPINEDKQEMLDLVAAGLKDDPGRAKMSWGGAAEGRVDITRHDVDKIISDEPFVMIAATGHGAWVNTATLEALGLMEPGAEPPVDGYEKAADGSYNGYLSSSAAAMYAVVKLGLIRKEDVAKNLPGVIADYNKYGLTAVLDAANPPGTEPVMYAAAKELEDRGELNLRIAGTATAQRPLHLEQAFEFMAELHKLYTSDMLKVDTLKLHGGSTDGYSAPLLEPYSDRPETNGPDNFPYDIRLEASMKAAKLGYNIHTHVWGDKGIREGLDAFQALREAGFTDIRLSTGHTPMIHPDDQPRFAKYDVVNNVMLEGVCQIVPTNYSRLGDERMEYWCPHRAVADSGARVSLSADAPTAPLDPMLQMEIAILHKTPEQTEALNGGRGGLTLEQAIRGYTIDSAYLIGWDDIVGSLEVGKRADLVVLSQNLFEIPPEEIHKTNVLLTMVNGRVVHEEGVDWDVSEPAFRYDAFGNEY